MTIFLFKCKIFSSGSAFLTSITMLAVSCSFLEVVIAGAELCCLPKLFAGYLSRAVTQLFLEELLL